MEINEVLTSELVPYANNARVHSSAQIEQIAKSIQEFGFNDPIGVWTNQDGEMEIVEGHGRLLAANLLGIERVPVIRLDNLTDQQRREYAIVHNATTDMSSFDPEILKFETSELNYEWDGLGVTIMDDSWLGEVFVDDDRAPREDSTPKEPSKLVCPLCGGEL